MVQLSFNIKADLIIRGILFFLDYSRLREFQESKKGKMVLKSINHNVGVADCTSMCRKRNPFALPTRSPIMSIWVTLPCIGADIDNKFQRLEGEQHFVERI